MSPLTVFASSGIHCVPPKAVPRLHQRVHYSVVADEPAGA